MLRVNLSKNFQFKWAWKCQVWLFLYLIGGNQISILIKLRMRKSVGAYNTLQEALYMDRLLLYFTVKNQNRKSTQENKPSRIMCQKLFSFFGFICRSFNWAKICEERVQNPRMVQNRNASSCIKWEEQKCWNPPLTSPRAFTTKLCFYLHKMHLHLKTLWARSFGKMLTTSSILTKIQKKGRGERDARCVVLVG